MSDTCATNDMTFEIVSVQSVATVEAVRPPPPADESPGYSSSKVLGMDSRGTARVPPPISSVRCDHEASTPPVVNNVCNKVLSK